MRELKFRAWKMHNGKLRNHHKGYTFKYEAEVIGNIHKQPELLEANDVD